MFNVFTAHANVIWIFQRERFDQNANTLLAQHVRWIHIGQNVENVKNVEEKNDLTLTEFNKYSRVHSQSSHHI